MRTLDTHIGEWSWNSALFSTKYEADPNTGCWNWRGAHHKAGGLFGAYKNGSPQMTQARRLAYMAHHNKTIDRRFIYSTCENTNCVNPAHHYDYKPSTYD